ncbi:hypothetical protein KDK88_07185 [bacterium]|nr:hypothetical protein [bacterium]
MNIRTLLISAALAAAFLCVRPQPLRAWSHDPLENDWLTDLQGLVGGIGVHPDGNGGRTILWAENRNGVAFHVYAMGVDASGQIAWGAGGLPVYQSLTDIIDVDSAVDANGSVYIAVTDSEDGVNADVFIQKLDPDGALPWGENPKNVAAGVAGGRQSQGVVAADGEGGCFVVWVDDRNAPTQGDDLYGQRVDADGGLRWGEDGLPLCTAPGGQDSPCLVPSLDAVVLVWRDMRNLATQGPDVYLNRIDAEGNPVWGAADVAACTAPGTQSDPQAVSDGLDGVILAWRDQRDAATGTDLYAQRFLVNGARMFPADGVALCAAAGEQTQFQLAADGAHGAYAGWEDRRPGDPYTQAVMYGQHLTGDGGVLWSADGQVLGGAAGAQYHLTLGVDGGGRLTAVWADRRQSTFSDLFGQILMPDGARIMGPAGAPLSTADRYQDPLDLTFDAADGALVVFLDDRTALNWSLRQQRLDASGFLGDPSPRILGATDAPQDQGGVVLLSWTRSWLDDPNADGIVSYSVWNRWTGAKAAPADPAQAAALAATLGADPAAVLDHLKAGWTFVGTTPAQEIVTYGFNAPTFADSTGAGEAPTEYQVVALGNAGEFWPSPAVSGISVDNLPPGAPLQLAGVLQGVDVVLTWSADPAVPDLAGYRVYRGTSSAVAPGAPWYVGTSADTTFTDPAPPAGPVHYIVTAVDVHGNESDKSNEVALESVTGVDGGGLPAAFALAGARPNPFNPATELRLEVPREGRVVLTIHDARGAVVRTLHDGSLSAGSHAVRWDGRADDGRAVASGAYFARARLAGGGVSTAKLLLAR